MDKKLIDKAFSPNNPAIVMLNRLREDPALRAWIAARLGCNTTLDEESFYEVAAKLEPPKGST